MFRFSCLLVAAALTTAAVPASAGDARLTRIEPRPFYGATISLEAGVRVFRALPRTRNMIINPGHRTPLNLSLKNVEVNETRTSTSHNYYYDYGSGYGGHGYSSFGGYGLPLVNRRRRDRGFGANAGRQRIGRRGAAGHPPWRPGPRRQTLDHFHRFSSKRLHVLIALDAPGQPANASAGHHFSDPLFCQRLMPLKRRC